MKKETTLVRIASKWHKELKISSAVEEISMIKILNRICRKYFEKD